MEYKLFDNQSARLKKNNFDLLRLIFSGIVVLIHTYQLSGFKELGVFSKFLSSDVAVKAFFIVSGFLIFMSYERSKSVHSYAMKRVKRIYPAYFTVIILCAFGLSLVSNLPPYDYFSRDWLKYLAANLVFLNTLQPSLPGVFQQNLIPAVDGALWTLKIEAMFYIAVPFIAICGERFGRFRVIALVYVLSALYSFIMALIAERTGSHIYIELARQLPGQLMYFMSGAFLYYYLPLFERKVVLFVSLAVAIFVVDSIFPIPFMVPAALATLVIFFGLFFYVGNFGKYGDFSYGSYILHFPLIQLLIASGWFAGSPWTLLAVTITLTAIGAFAMWNLVENRFLHRGRNAHVSAPLTPLTGDCSTASRGS